VRDILQNVMSECMEVDEIKCVEVEPEAVTKKRQSLIDQASSYIPRTFTDEELGQFMSLVDLREHLLWGYQMKAVLKSLGIHLYKFTSKNGNHNSYQFVAGRNVDPLAANHFSTRECSGGKFYFYPAIAQTLHVWFDYNGRSMQDAWDVCLCDESRVVIENGFKGATDEFELLNKRPISSLPEWNDPAAVEIACSTALRNVTRINEAVIPAIMKFTAVDADVYRYRPEFMKTEGLAMQYMLVNKYPEFVLEMENPGRELLCVAVRVSPSLVTALEKRGLLDDELLHLAISQDYSLIGKLNNLTEEMLRHAFESLKAFDNASGYTDRTDLLQELLQREMPLSSGFLIWMISKFKIAFQALVKNKYDSDEIRAHQIGVNALNAVKALTSESTDRPLSDELKWLALRADEKCYQHIESPTKEMSEYAFSKDDSLRLFSAETSMETAVEILTKYPFLIESMRAPVAEELIFAAISANPTVHGLVPGDRSTIDLLRICPFVYGETASYDRTEALQLAAVESVIAHKDKLDVLDWMRLSNLVIKNDGCSSHRGLLQESIMQRLLDVFPHAILDYRGANSELGLYALKKDITLFPRMMKLENASDFASHDLIKYAVSENPEYLSLVPKYISLEESFMMELVGAHPSSVLLMHQPPPIVVCLATTRDGRLVKAIEEKFGDRYKNVISNFLVVSPAKKRRVEEEKEENISPRRTRSSPSKREKTV